MPVINDRHEMQAKGGDQHTVRLFIVANAAMHQVSIDKLLNITIQDTIGREWLGEPIEWQLPGAKGDTVRLERDGQPIPAQVVATEGGVRGLFVIDRLAKDASTTVTAELGRPGPAETDLKVTEEKDALVLGNKFTAVRVNRGRKDNLPSQVTPNTKGNSLALSYSPAHKVGLWLWSLCSGLPNANRDGQELPLRQQT